MRNIWDEERRAAKPKRESTVFSRSRVAVGKQADVRPEAVQALKSLQARRDSVPFDTDVSGQKCPREEGLAKARKYFLEYLELKRVVMDFFPDYQMYLGEGGFTKI